MSSDCNHRARVLRERKKEYVSRIRQLVAVYKKKKSEYEALGPRNSKKRREMTESINAAQKAIEADPFYPSVCRRTTSETYFDIWWIERKSDAILEAPGKKRHYHVKLYGSKTPFGCVDSQQFAVELSETEIEEVLVSTKKEIGDWWTAIVEMIEGSLPQTAVKDKDELRTKVMAILGKMEHWDEVKE